MALQDRDRAREARPRRAGRHARPDPVHHRRTQRDRRICVLDCGQHGVCRLRIQRDARGWANPVEIWMRMESNTRRTRSAPASRPTLPYRSTRRQRRRCPDQCAMSLVLAERCSSASVTAGCASGRSARAPSLDQRGDLGEFVLSPRPASTITAVAAAATVVPYLVFSISDTISLGMLSAAASPHGTCRARGAAPTVSIDAEQPQPVQQAGTCRRSESRRR